MGRLEIEMKRRRFLEIAGAAVGSVLLGGCEFDNLVGKVKGGKQELVRVEIGGVNKCDNFWLINGTHMIVGIDAAGWRDWCREWSPFWTADNLSVVLKEDYRAVDGGKGSGGEDVRVSSGPPRLTIAFNVATLVADLERSVGVRQGLEIVSRGLTFQVARSMLRHWDEMFGCGGEELPVKEKQLVEMCNLERPMWLALERVVMDPVVEKV